MKVPASLLDIARKLKENGKELYVVGGAVRDYFIKQSGWSSEEPHDFDLATDALPSEIQNLFPHTVPTGIDHGTVTIICSDQHYEITTYRKDGKYSDGRRPDVIEPVRDIEEDLSRRDFTMNAIAYDPLKKTYQDPFAGAVDIGNKTVCCVGSAKDRFSEDGLRILRAIRFAAKFGFSLSKDIIKSFKDAKIIDMLDKISAERIRDELTKMLTGKNIYYALDCMNKYGILEKIIPELKKCDGFLQNGHHKYDVLKHTFLAVAETGMLNAPLEVRLAALLHDIGKPDTAELKADGISYGFPGHEELSASIAKTVLDRLKYPNEIRDKVVHLVDRHMAPCNYVSAWSKAAVRRFVIKVGVENLDNLFSLHYADLIATGTHDDKLLIELKKRVNDVLSEKPPLKITNLKINGYDLMDKVGIKQGPALGKILNALFEAVTENPELNTRDCLLGLAKDFLEKQNETG